MKHRDYKIVAVDFDGTLCKHDYPLIGEANYRLIDDLTYYRSRGNKLILWTCRRDKHLQDAIEWCKSLGLEFDTINENLPEIIEEMGGNSRKIYADYYLDDKAVSSFSHYAKNA